MNPPPTLFLDFDGVLHPNGADDAEAFSLAPVLAAALAPFDCRIVISSSWRFHVPLDEILARLPDPIGARVVGRTGKAFIGPHPRFREITAWVERYAVRDWRALDDSHFEFPNPCPQLIRCPGDTGIGVQQVALISAWLTRGSGVRAQRRD